MSTPHTSTCATCGATIKPISGRKVGRTPGVIETGSFPESVVNWLHDHPGEELTCEDIATKFDRSGKLKPHDVAKRLAVAILYGYVETLVSARGKRIFRKPPTRTFHRFPD